MTKILPPKAIQVWIKSVDAAKKTYIKPIPSYGFVSKGLLRTSLQIYCAKTSYGTK